MTSLVAFASLPFGLKGGVYAITAQETTVNVHVSELRFNPFVVVTPRPDLAQTLLSQSQTRELMSYTWYDHPFVLRVVFGRRVAALGSINSCATIVHPLGANLDLDDSDLITPLHDQFTGLALEALNKLIGAVRRRAPLYHIFDLNREDIQISIRDDRGRVLREDPLEPMLGQEDERHTERFDLLDQSEDWYQELASDLLDPSPGGLADDLLMEAERALVQRFPRQAIATCYTAIETAASSLLTVGMSRRGLPDERIDDMLSTKTLLAKLDALLVTYTGFSLRQHNRPLWKAVTQLGDVRNSIVHRGSQPSAEDAAAAIETTRQVLRWLTMVRSRFST